MNRVLNVLGTVVAGFLNWVYSLPPDSFREYEFALVGYLITVHLINPQDQATWIAAGFAMYGIIKAIRDVSNASIVKVTLSSNANKNIV